MKIVAGNWKMNHGPAETRRLIGELLPRVSALARTAVWLAPPALSLPAAHEARSGSSLLLGAQNVHWESRGAFTGELSRSLLREVGCSFAIVGHSERRHLFGEPEELCARRALGNLADDFRIIFCVGETLAERRGSATHLTLDRQLKPLFAGLRPEDAALVILAYEPVWAIGTGVVAGVDEIAEAHAYLCMQFAMHRLPPPQILYGGSVSPKNVRAVLGVPHVDGVLVGSASLAADTFGELIAASEELS